MVILSFSLHRRGEGQSIQTSTCCSTHWTLRWLHLHDVNNHSHTRHCIPVHSVEHRLGDGLKQVLRFLHTSMSFTSLLNISSIKVAAVLYWLCTAALRYPELQGHRAAFIIQDRIQKIYQVITEKKDCTFIFVE